MIALTKDMRAGTDRIAIVLDGEVMSAPVVQSAPLGRQFVITGMSGYEESRNLANALLNPLKNELQVEEERTVSPTLGKAVVQQGIWAGIVGLAITFVFVLIYYRVGRLHRADRPCREHPDPVRGDGDVRLHPHPSRHRRASSSPSAWRWMPTCSSTSDCARKLAAGKSLRSAIDAAYEKAFSAIFDANITSLLTAMVLFWRASGTVKGFAVTLTVGLLGSMFAALLVGRVLFRWGNRRQDPDQKPLLPQPDPQQPELRLPRQAQDRRGALDHHGRLRRRRLRLEGR